MVMRSTHVEAHGGLGRILAAHRIHKTLNEAPEFREAVQQLRSLDLLKREHWPDPRGCAGYGTDTISRQDGSKGALIENQLIPAEVQDILQHVHAAVKTEHPQARESMAHAHNSPHAARTQAAQHSGLETAASCT